jgi:pimeloyl-ACP methyl ester carboxylesterase
MTSTAPTQRRFGELSGQLVPGDDDTRAPLVFLHGLTFDRSSWAPTLDVLHATDPGRATLALDLPGHGESADCFRGFEAARLQIHEAIADAAFDAPLVVGHSAGAIAATMYAAAFETRGVVNIDQPLQNDDFVARLMSMRAQLDSDDFERLWFSVFMPSMHPESLPAEAEALVRSTSRPRGEIALGYWWPVLDGRLEDTKVQVDEGLAVINAAGVPYVTVTGSRVDPAYRAWLHERLPRATFVEWPGCGHFPHLARPDDFAHLLSKV